jgi:hypothetical protein
MPILAEFEVLHGRCQSVVAIDVSNAQCPPQLQPGYNPCHHCEQHYVFFMTRRDEICVRLHSLASKRMARIVLRMHAL